MAVRKLRAGVFGGIAMLGAGVMLSACSPVQMGAAAIVGNQRISQSTLSANVSDLQSAAARFPAGQVQLTSAQMPRAVLALLVQFDIMDRAAKDAGITLSQTQAQYGLGFAEQQFDEEASQASQQGESVSAQSLALSNGLSPSMMDAFGRYRAQQIAIVEKASGGKMPTTQAENTKANAVLAKAGDQAMKELNIKINPQYGKLDPSQGTIVAGPDLLSKAAASASAAAPAAS